MSAQDIPLNNSNFKPRMEFEKSNLILYDLETKICMQINRLKSIQNINHRIFLFFSHIHHGQICFLQLFNSRNL